MEKFKVIKPDDSDCVLVLADETIYIGYYYFSNHHTYPHMLKNKADTILGEFTGDAKWTKCNPTHDEIGLTRLSYDLSNPHILKDLKNQTIS